MPGKSITRMHSHRRSIHERTVKASRHKEYRTTQARYRVGVIDVVSCSRVKTEQSQMAAAADNKTRDIANTPEAINAQNLETAKGNGTHRPITFQSLTRGTAQKVKYLLMVTALAAANRESRHRQSGRLAVLPRSRLVLLHVGMILIRLHSTIRAQYCATASTPSSERRYVLNRHV